MDSQFIQVIRQAIANGWCIEPFCTTCGNMEYRKALDEIQELTDDLAGLDIRKLSGVRNWSKYLRIVSLTQGFRINWNTVLRSWLPNIQGNVPCADHVLFYVIRYMPIRTEAAQEWIEVCIRLGIETEDPSLVESLICVLGRRVSKYPQLLAVAFRLSDQFALLKNALVKAGFLPSEEELRHQEKRIREAEKATKNLFGAIRRNDIKAVAALLRKSPDLSAMNDDCQTPWLMFSLCATRVN